ncbi:hypothetical protein AVEN_7986-1, partial [Araneus ventricosus]
NLASLANSSIHPANSTWPTHQLLRVIEHIHEGKANRLATAAIFLDIAKAFDKVWIQGLIHKTNRISFSALHYQNNVLLSPRQIFHCCSQRY